MAEEKSFYLPLMWQRSWSAAKVKATELFVS